MLFLPLSQHVSRVLGDASLRRKRLVRRIRAWLRKQRLTSLLDVPDRLRVIGKLPVVGHGNARLPKDFHSLCSIQLPRSAFGSATDYHDAPVLPPGELEHGEPVGFQEAQIGPFHARSPIWNYVDQTFPNRTRTRVVFAGEGPHLVTMFFCPEGDIEQPVKRVRD